MLNKKIIAYLTLIVFCVCNSFSANASDKNNDEVHMLTDNNLLVSQYASNSTSFFSVEPSVDLKGCDIFIFDVEQKTKMKLEEKYSGSSNIKLFHVDNPDGGLACCADDNYLYYFRFGCVSEIGSRIDEIESYIVRISLQDGNSQKITLPSFYHISPNSGVASSENGLFLMTYHYDLSTHSIDFSALTKVVFEDEAIRQLAVFDKNNYMQSIVGCYDSVLILFSKTIEDGFEDMPFETKMMHTSSYLQLFSIVEQKVLPFFNGLNDYGSSDVSNNSLYYLLHDNIVCMNCKTGEHNTVFEGASTEGILENQFMISAKGNYLFIDYGEDEDIVIEKNSGKLTHISKEYQVLSNNDSFFLIIKEYKKRIVGKDCVYYPILEAIPVSDFVKGCFDSAIIFQ